MKVGGTMLFFFLQTDRRSERGAVIPRVDHDRTHRHAPTKSGNQLRAVDQAVVGGVCPQRIVGGSSPRKPAGRSRRAESGDPRCQYEQRMCQWSRRKRYRVLGRPSNTHHDEERVEPPVQVGNPADHATPCAWMMALRLLASSTSTGEAHLLPKGTAAMPKMFDADGDSRTNHISAG